MLGLSPEFGHGHDRTRCGELPRLDERDASYVDLSTSCSEGYFLFDRLLHAHLVCLPEFRFAQEGKNNSFFTMIIQEAALRFLRPGMSLRAPCSSTMYF